jgi:hypothetical protein
MRPFFQEIGTPCKAETKNPIQPHVENHGGVVSLLFYGK